MDISPTACGLLVSFTVIVIGLIYRYVQNVYKIVGETNLPKASSILPFGSWFGVWNKVLGEEDIKNVTELGKIYWTFDGSSPNLIVCDLDLIKILLKEKQNDFESHRALRVSSTVLQSALKAIERKPEQTKDVFTPTNIKKLIPRIERSVEVLVQEIRKKEGNIYLQPIFMQYIGDMIAMTVFGIDLYSEEFKDQQAKFMEHINTVMRVSDPTSFFPDNSYCCSSCKMDNSVLPPCAETFFSDLCYAVVKKKREVASIELEGKGVDVIDLLLEASNKGKKLSEDLDNKVEEIENDDSDILIQCLGIILYTVRSTETSLCSAMHILSNSEEEQTKVHKELSNLRSSLGDKGIGVHCLEAKYLDMFLKEVLRLYPIEYRLSRVTKTDMKLGEINLPSDVSVSIPIYALHRLPEFYTEPLTFDPERFSIDKLKEAKEMSFIPYGQASSNPSFVGIDLIKLFIKIAITHLILNFSIVQPLPYFQADFTFAKGATEVPKAMPVMVQLEKRA